MPTGTFFRLPEEKKTRLIDAAWKEFTRTKFSDTSISRIIQEAGIPRGSFYQYFADKEDVLEYLLNDIRDYFIQMFMDAMQTTDGDLFKMPMLVFDQTVRENGEIDAGVRRCMKLLQMNPGMELQNSVFRHVGDVLDSFPFRQQIDISRMRAQDDTFIKHVFTLVVKITAATAAEVLTGAVEREKARQAMSIDLDILQYGCIAPQKETATAIRRNTR